MRAPTRREIEDGLPQILRAFDLVMPSLDEALKTAVDNYARRIVVGTLDPIDGAFGIWDFWGFGREADTNPLLFEQIEAFIAIAHQAEDFIAQDDMTSGPPPSDLGLAVIREAEAFLERGGLRVPG
jgi:hypothetical protein